MAAKNEVELPLPYIILPSNEDVEDFIGGCKDQLQHITGVALKIFNKHKLESRIKFDKFLAIFVMIFLSGRITTLQEIGIASEVEGETSSLTNIVDELTQELKNE